MIDNQDQPSAPSFNSHSASLLDGGSPQNSFDRSAAEFLDEFSASGAYRRDLLARLIHGSLSDDPAGAQAATQTFFSTLVEPLADSFEPAPVDLYNRVFSHLIQTFLESPPAPQLHRTLP